MSNENLPLFKYGTLPPFQKGSETSEAAAVAKLSTLARCQRRYLDWVAARGRHGATDHEAAAGIPMPLSSVCARRNELMSEGLVVVRAGVKRLTPWDKRAFVFWAPAGRTL